MRSRFLAATALTGAAMFLVPGAVLAQDAYDWSGFYAGITVGGAINSSEIEWSAVPFDEFPEDDAESGSLTGSEQALAIGLVGGYNWQTGSIVYGVEADASALSLNQSVSSDEVSAETSLHALLTARARVGLAVDRLLFYGTGGLAVGKVSSDTSYSGDLGKGSTSDAATGIGFAAGAGAEYAVTENATLRLEGLYYRLGGLDGSSDTTRVSFEGDPPSPVFESPGEYSARTTISGALIRAGLNVKF